MVMSVDAPPRARRRSSTSGTATQAERREILEHVEGRSREPGRPHRRHPHVHRRRPDDHRRVGGDPVGVELVGGSATSLGFPSTSGSRRRRCDALRVAADPHVKFADFDRRGYGVVTVAKNKLGREFFAVDALTKGAAARRRWRRSTSRPGRGLERVAEAQLSEEICEPVPPAWSAPGSRLVVGVAQREGAGDRQHRGPAARLADDRPPPLDERPAGRGGSGRLPGSAMPEAKRAP